VQKLNIKLTQAVVVVDDIVCRFFQEFRKIRLLVTSNKSPGKDKEKSKGKGLKRKGNRK